MFSSMGNNIVKMSIFLKWINKFNVIPINVFYRCIKSDCKIYMEYIHRLGKPNIEPRRDLLNIFNLFLATEQKQFNGERIDILTNEKIRNLQPPQ